MTLKSHSKFEEKLTLSSKNDKEFGEFLMRAVESLKICTLMSYFHRKYIIFEPEKYRRDICHNTEE